MVKGVSNPKWGTRKVPLQVAVASALAVALWQSAYVASGSAATGSRGPRPQVSVNRRVIVIMKSQPGAVRPGTPAAAMRSAAIASAQAPLLRELRLSHASRIVSYRLVNAFAATVSAAEAARLTSSPAVAEVVP